MIKRKRVKVYNTASQKEKKRGARGTGRKGRPKGSQNQTTLKLQRMAEAKKQMLPHEFFLEVINCGLAGKKVGPFDVTMEDMKWAASRGARFFAPELQAISVSGQNGGPLTVMNIPPEMLKSMPTEELKLLERLLGTLGGQPPKQIEGQAVDSTPGNAEAYAKAIGETQ